MKKCFYLFFTFFIFNVWFSIAQETKPLGAEDVKTVMSQILKQHVDQKDLSEKIIKSSFKIYIDQFDPERIYLLQSEVEPFLNPSPSAIQETLQDWKNSQFKAYERLNAVIERSISRADQERKMWKGKISFNGTAEIPKIDTEDFAKNLDDLRERQKTNYLLFLKGQYKKLGQEAFNTKQNQFDTLYDNTLIGHEKEYFLTKGLSSREERQSLFYMHVLKGLAKGLDAHTSYLNNQEAFDMRVRLEKSMDGIGILIRKEDKGYVISKVLEGGPASNSGKIKPEDSLIKIDGEAIDQFDLTDVVERLRGKVGTTVLLTIQSPGKPVENVKLTRKTIPVNEGRVTYRYVSVKGGIIGVIKLTSFYQNDLGVSAESDIRKAIENLSKKGSLKGLVLDLRENSGGFLSQAVKVAGLFITNGVVVISKYSNGEERLYRDMDGKISYDGPLVILTSKVTASAAEIVAQALQDYGIALVVGDEQTYGKGTIQSQTVTEGDASSFFKVTVGKYYTASGKTPQERGVKADIVIPSILNGQDIGEEYLESHMSNDHINPVFQDSLQDIDPGLRPWYLRYYIPTLQKQATTWKEMLPTLRENSNARLKSDGYTDKIQAENFGYNMKDDLQLLETVNVVKDMILQEPKFERRGLTTQTTRS